MEFIGLISDTHITAMEQKLPARIDALFKGAKYILHAGDITHNSVLDRLETIAPVVAVQGNMDSNPGILSLPVKNLVHFRSFTIGLIHGGGSPLGIRDRIYREFEGINPDIIVYGHTHKALIIEEKGCCWINPGSATVPRYPPYPTVAVIRFENSGFEGEILKL